MAGSAQMLLVTPNMHDFNGVFLLPAMLLIRREFALVAAILTASYTAEGLWLGSPSSSGPCSSGCAGPPSASPSSGA